MPKAWLRIVEEQSRLTLHAHCLIWIYGHSDIEKQLKRAATLSGMSNTNWKIHHVETEERENANDSSLLNYAPLTTTTGDPHSESKHDSNSTIPHCVDTILQRLKENIDTFAVGELMLPSTEIEMILLCCNPECHCSLQVQNSKILFNMRKRPCVGSTEPEALSCDSCSTNCSISSRINAALDHGYQRCYGRSKLSENEIIDLVWTCLPTKPALGNELEMDRWLLNLASIQMHVNSHDWKHRGSCFKNGRKTCRYNTPHTPNQESTVEPVFAVITESKVLPTSSTSNQSSESDEILHLNINLRKRCPFLLLTDCNPRLMAALNCNNCTRYVENQKVSLYYGAYASKHSGENEKALAEVIRSLNSYEAKIIEQRRQIEEQNATKFESTDSAPIRPIRTDSSIGMGKLLAAARASTNGETVGAPLAAFAARGNPIFSMSHETATLPLSQALAFLENRPLTAPINKSGTAFSSVFDYIYRNTSAKCFDSMNFWEFTTTQRRVSLSNNIEHIGDSEDDSDEEFNGKLFQMKVI